jgi:hypothetical protein
VVIGVDFDNTLICYDQAFHQVALAEGLIPAGTPAAKREVRDAVRLGPSGEPGWQRLQSQVYGPRIRQSRPAAGAREFLDRCARERVPVFIISHKTEFATLDPGTTSLRRAALDWLEGEGFFTGAGLGPGSVRFGATRAEKLDHIRQTRCTHFIDDLEEVFREPAFPAGVQGILYAPDRERLADLPGVALARSWSAVMDRIFGG